MSARPVLWHIPISHYNEKVRWALDYKGVEHERRAPVPGAHMLVALAHTRGKHKTFPMLRLDGRTIGDSTAIIAALEDRYPEPPLYPSEAAERRRALELEEFLDEELGPHPRLLAFHHSIRDPEAVAAITDEYLPGSVRSFGPARAVFAAAASGFARARYRVASDDAAEEARRRIAAVLDRLEDELGDRDYLVGGRFTVADLTAAALLYPIALPAEGPRVPAPSPSLEAVLDEFDQRPAIAWVREMFARHRRPKPG